jgi:hypothetical protein
VLLPNIGTKLIVDVYGSVAFKEAKVNSRSLSNYSASFDKKPAFP